MEKTEDYSSCLCLKNKYISWIRQKQSKNTRRVFWRAVVFVADWAVTGGSPISPVYSALVLLSTLCTAEHNRKQFLEILFLMVSFRLLISDLRRKSVTVLILCFLFEERWCWWWCGCASRELKQVLVLRNQTNVSFFVFFFIKSFLFICIFIHILTHKKYIENSFSQLPHVIFCSS